MSDTNQELGELSEATQKLASGFIGFVSEGLKKLERQGAGMAQTAALDGAKTTAREFVMAAAIEYANHIAPHGLDSSRNHRVREYRKLL